MKFSLEQAVSAGVGVRVTTGVGVTTGFDVITILRSSRFDSEYSELPG